MPALASDLRKTLEATVVKAREKAEGGARDALTALAVNASEPFASMSEEERRLRNRLRARGRQLGDQRDPQKGTQSIERLVREMAGLRALAPDAVRPLPGGESAADRALFWVVDQPR